MGKYDMDQGMIRPGTSWWMVLSHVRKGSEVMEFGCASGYMTKYMMENLDCEVDVFDRNLQDLNVAAEWARRVWNGDIDNGYDWWPFYRNYRYDHVLFSDVLEHLRDPEKALDGAKDILRDDGTIIISVPNICHNDILIKMFYNNFTYTPVGLLDDTHIHFWGLNDLLKMFDRLGLEIDSIESVIRQTGTTEQFTALSKVNPDLMKALRTRPEGETYQYVIALRKAR